MCGRLQGDKINKVDFVERHLILRHPPQRQGIVAPMRDLFRIALKLRDV